MYVIQLIPPIYFVSCTRRLFILNDRAKLFLRIIICTRMIFALGLSSLNYGVESMRVSIKFIVKKGAALIRARLIAHIFIHLILRPGLSAARRENGDHNHLT